MKEVTLDVGIVEKLGKMLMQVVNLNSIGKWPVR